MPGKRYKTGMYGGSFDPMHIGHLRLILKAQSMCDTLYIVISASEERDRIPLNERYRWIYNSVRHLPNVKLLLLKDHEVSKEAYDNADAWEQGAVEVHRMIGGPVDAVFCGSDYQGRNLWEKLYPEAEVIYEDRNEVPVSSTEIYHDPFRYWDYIPKMVRPYFVKKILFVGGESTGKSTIVTNLAEYYNTEYVEEYGRLTCDEAGGEDFVSVHDLEMNILYQKTTEWEKQRIANKLLFIDTDALTTKWFASFLLEHDTRRQAVEKLADAVTGIREFDLVFFMEPTVPFVQDGTRNERLLEDRKMYSEQIKAEFKKAGMEMICLDGDYNDRFRKVIDIIHERYHI